jgi:hypothetical protein
MIIVLAALVAFSLGTAPATTATPAAGHATGTYHDADQLCPEVSRLTL